MLKVFPHHIEYETRAELTLLDVADALLAQHALVQFLPAILERALPGLHVESVKISLKEAEIGSLREEFLVALFLGFQEDLQQEVVGGIEAMTGIEILEKYDTIVTLLVILVVLYGARFVYEKLRGHTAAPPPAIAGNYNRVLNVTAKTLHITPDLLDEAVSGGIGQQPPQALTRATTKFMKPAKKGDAAPINGAGTELISAEAVREFPVEAELLDDERPMIPFPDVRLEILALDRQKHASGWAARFIDKEVPASRLTMDLYPTVDIAPLRTAVAVRADVIVEYKQISGGTKPAKIHLVRVGEILE